MGSYSSIQLQRKQCYLLTQNLNLDLYSKIAQKLNIDIEKTARLGISAGCITTSKIATNLCSADEVFANEEKISEMKKNIRKWSRRSRTEKQSFLAAELLNSVLKETFTKFDFGIAFSSRLRYNRYTDNDKTNFCERKELWIY